MSYSLLSRFQGYILGSIIGDYLASKPNQQAQITTIKPEKLSPETQIGMRTLAILAQGQSWEQSQIIKEFLSSLEPKNTSSSQLILATLPIVLLFHDQQEILSKQLKTIQTIDIYSNSWEEFLMWSDTISLTLQGKLTPQQLIPQLLTRKERLSSTLVGKLTQIQNLLSEKASLYTVITKLSEGKNHSATVIATALYCFVSTPEDFQLCITRAKQSPYQTQITTAITGAIAGAYNGLLGIPLPWRLANQPWSQLNILQPTKQLFAQWCGVYPSHHDSNQDFHAVISSPNFIS